VHVQVTEAENSLTLILPVQSIYSTDMVVQKGSRLCVCIWIYLPGLWIHNQDYEYWAHLACKGTLYILHSDALSTFVIKLVTQL